MVKMNMKVSVYLVPFVQDRFVFFFKFLAKLYAFFLMRILKE